MSREEERMRVADLMQRDVKTVSEDATIAEAVTALVDAQVSGLPVLDGAGKIVGVISTTDVLEAESETADSEGRERLFESTRVSEIMTRQPRVIGPAADLRSAAQQMLRQQVHRLFVEEHGVLVGVVSQTDIVRAVATIQL
jgi:CBS domain-containing protein